MLTDPIADMLTRIRNANQALHDTVDMPLSKMKVSIAQLLQEEGYLAGVDVVDDRTLRVRLRYDSQRRRVLSGLKRESKPGRRVYLAGKDVPRVLGGMGIAVLSTSQGLLTGHEARRRGLGGELVCTVW
ncbi:MAG TPA: 30S ribosomal protein S8 [Miltoncostaeaceae bacterium]|nr:30S ribosomal protein S8 [Miltoncostaeaceae bacterium]